MNWNLPLLWLLLSNTGRKKCQVLLQSEFLISSNIYYRLSVHMYHPNSLNNYQDLLNRFYITNCKQCIGQILNFIFPSGNTHRYTAYKHSTFRIFCIRLDICNMLVCSSKKYQYTQYICLHCPENIVNSFILSNIEHKYCFAKPICSDKQYMNCCYCKSHQGRIFYPKITYNQQNIANKFCNHFMNNWNNLIGKDLCKGLLSECNQFYIFYKLLNLHIKNILNHIFCKLHYLSIRHLNKH